ncbi:hypothetical protein D9M70_72780 [compost metagenome]
MIFIAGTRAAIDIQVQGARGLDRPKPLNLAEVDLLGPLHRPHGVAIQLRLGPVLTRGHKLRLFDVVQPPGLCPQQNGKLCGQLGTELLMTGQLGRDNDPRFKALDQHGFTGADVGPGLKLNRLEKYRRQRYPVLNVRTGRHKPHRGQCLADVVLDGGVQRIQRKGRIRH